VGNNLDSSLDTGFAEFGFVKREQVLGKPLMVDLATDPSSIGCDLK
jgi:hypothetical protein